MPDEEQNTSDKEPDDISNYQKPAEESEAEIKEEPIPPENTSYNEPTKKSEYQVILEEWMKGREVGGISNYDRTFIVKLFESFEKRQSIVYGQIVDTFKQLGDFVSQVAEIKEVVSKLSKEVDKYNPENLAEKITELKSGYDKLSEQLSEISNKFGEAYTNSANQINGINKKPNAQPEVSSSSVTNKNVYSQLDELYKSVSLESKYMEVAETMQTITKTFPELNKALELLIQNFNTNGDSKIKDSDLNNLKNVVNGLKAEYKNQNTEK